MEYHVCMILRELGILSSFTGYRYLLEAVLLVQEKNEGITHITKDVYPELAKRYHVSVWAIENNIRNVIEHCWKRTNPEKIEKYFPGMSGLTRPTNTQFIERIADCACRM